MTNTNKEKETREETYSRYAYGCPPCAYYYISTRGYVKPNRQASATKEDRYKMRGVE